MGRDYMHKYGGFSGVSGIASLVTTTSGFTSALLSDDVRTAIISGTVAFVGLGWQMSRYYHGYCNERLNLLQEQNRTLQNGLERKVSGTATEE
ncbi:MAG TPA: hypothetical protein VJH20_04055 [Candidatus Nanoarchaeia archaeon]|nr:hypothetical protein [Candidatus Nanoarchaeia archaeon]